MHLKHLLCVGLIVFGFIGVTPSTDARTLRPTRVGSERDGIVYESNRPRRTVQLVQLALRRRGYNPAIVSGEFVAETRIAIKRYQRDRGMRQTGKIDRALLRSLGIR
jgi:peptidoglycan hydrolase-like protein with peptidoglycan-binding domain